MNFIKRKRRYTTGRTRYIKERKFSAWKKNKRHGNSNKMQWQRTETIWYAMIFELECGHWQKLEGRQKKVPRWVQFCVECEQSQLESTKAKTEWQS